MNVWKYSDGKRWEIKVKMGLSFFDEGEGSDL